jgi:hypothetical protein
MTESSEVALGHLQAIKPRDGWAVDRTFGGIRLLRRNVPVVDAAFLDIHLDPLTKTVVGIVNKSISGVQAQVLVDANGRLVAQKTLVTVQSWQGRKTVPLSSSHTPRTGRSATNTAADNRSDEFAEATLLSSEQNQALLKYGASFFGGLLLLRVLVQTMWGLSILALPLGYLYLVQTCPPESSFDAKKELKRVLRGHHLPESDPNKPKGFLSATLARINASVATELATTLGYEVTMVPLAGAAVVSSVRVPSAALDFYWVGVHGSWYYVYSMELADATKRD